MNKNIKCENSAESLKTIAGIIDFSAGLLVALIIFAGIYIAVTTDISLFAVGGIVLGGVTIIVFHAFTTLLYGFSKLISDTEKNKNATEKLLEITCSINGIKYEKTKKAPVKSPCFNETKQTSCNDEKHDEYRRKIKNTILNTEDGEWISSDLLGEKTFICNKCGEIIAYESDFSAEETQ